MVDREGRPAVKLLATFHLRQMCGACLAALCFLLLAGAAHADEGRLDKKFGNGGVSVSKLYSSVRFGPTEIASQPDSSVILSNGQSVIRYGSNGRRDPSFAAGGRLILGEELANEGISAGGFHEEDIAADSHGRILVFGTRTDSSHFYNPELISGVTAEESAATVLRFSPEGQPDPNFGEGRGFVTSSFGLGSKLPTTIPLVDVLAGGVDSEDRPIIVAGVASVVSGCYAKQTLASIPTAVVRLSGSGSLDDSFGSSESA